MKNEAAKRFPTLIINQHIIMISEESWKYCITNIKQFSIVINNTFFCILIKNAALISRRDYFNLF